MDLATNFPINLPVLLETRALVQANSGAGKSWLLRRLLEQTAPKVQQLVVDPEGEFSTLREKFDYVIAAPHDGDALATPQTAALLARRLLESGVSAILDIYDLKAHERILFVQRFFDALVNAPKALWHPLLIVLDEAHIFAPQNGSAPSASAVIDIATRGRKRGQCLVAATQRLSKLHKDVAAELGNKMIGRTGLDVDVKRAADELGLTSREGMEALRALKPGEFYIFGPALSQKVERVRVGDVRTSHPKAGNRMMAAPPAPSPKLRAQLATLADLQKDAEQEARTIEELKTDNAKLRREATLANKRAEQAGVPEAQVQLRIRAAIKEHEKTQLPPASTFDDAAAAMEKVVEIAAQYSRRSTGSRGADGDGARSPDRVGRAASPTRPSAVAASAAGRTGLPAGEAAVLTVIAQNPNGCTAEQISVITGYKRSTRNTYLQRLREKGYADTSGAQINTTAAGIAALGSDFKPLPIGAELREHWFARLPQGERRILELLCDAYPKSVSGEEMSGATEYSRSSRNTYLQRLRSRQLVLTSRDGVIASRILFD